MTGKGKMKKNLSVIICAVLFLGVLIGLTEYNRSCAVSVDKLSPGTVEQSGPVLIRGETISYTDKGEVCRFSFPWRGEIYLFFPSATDILIPEVNSRLLDAYRGRLYRVDGDVNGYELEIEITASHETLSSSETSVYIGTYAQLADFNSTMAVWNTFIDGFCFAIMLFSVILLMCKTSEKYLLYLACFAFIVGSYQRLLSLFSFLGLNILTDMNLYQVVDQVLAAFFIYKILEQFMPVRIGNRAFPIYCLVSAIPAVITFRSSGLFNIFLCLYFFVFYICLLICFVRIPEQQWIERNLMLFAWACTTGLRYFDVFCDIGLIPSGDINLRVRLRGITAVIYVAALFIIACRRFALKYEEADRLNVSLEEEIEKKAREDAAFTRSMLHNLKTPLFSVSGYTDMAMKSVDDNPEQAKSYIGKAHDKAIYAGKLMDNISLFMRMNSNQLAIEPVPMDLSETVRTCCETDSVEAEKAGVKLTCLLDGPAVIYGDPLYIQQAVQNLIDNAIINTPAGGTVTVSIDRSDNKSNWYVHVRDTGHGIEKENLEKIFEAYYSDRHGKASSTGLGLYIARTIVELHSGKIAVSSKLGEGSDFYIDIPAMDETSK